MIYLTCVILLLTKAKKETSSLLIFYLERFRLVQGIIEIINEYIPELLPERLVGQAGKDRHILVLITQRGIISNNYSNRGGTTINSSSVHKNRGFLYLRRKRNDTIR